MLGIYLYLGLLYFVGDIKEQGICLDCSLYPGMSLLGQQPVKPNPLWVSSQMLTTLCTSCWFMMLLFLLLRTSPWHLNSVWPMTIIRHQANQKLTNLNITCRPKITIWKPAGIFCSFFFYPTFFWGGGEKSRKPVMIKLERCDTYRLLRNFQAFVWLFRKSKPGTPAETQTSVGKDL